MTSQNNTATIYISFSTSEENAIIGAIIALFINAFTALILLFAIFRKIRRRHLIFYLNILMLISVILMSSVSISFEWGLLRSLWYPALEIATIFFLSIIKIIVELILVVRLYTLHPENRALLTGCGLLMLIRVVDEAYGSTIFFLSDYHRIYTLLFVVEPFLQAINNIFFSSIFIWTLTTRMCDVKQTIGGLRRHRLFLFLVLAAENMVVPCLTSILLAVYSVYSVDDQMYMNRYILTVVNIGITVFSIILTTLLGSSSVFKHYTLEEIDETPRAKKIYNLENYQGHQISKVGDSEK